MTVLLSDTFTRANATTLGNAETGQPWVSYGAQTMGVFNNEAYSITSNGDNSFVGCDVGISNAKIGVTFSNIASIGSWSSAIILRAISNTSYIHFQISPSGYILETYNSGDYSTLASYTGVTTGDQISIVINGSSIVVLRNDTQIMSVTSTFNQTATIFGMQSGDQTGTAGNRFDNFKVEDLSSGTTYTQTVGGASLSPAGTVQHSPRYGKTVGQATLTPSGIVRKRTSKRAGQATVTPTQQMTKRTTKSMGQATVTPSSTLGRGMAIVKSVGGAIVTPFATLAQTLAGLAVSAGGAILQPIGSLIKRTYKGVGGTVTPVGNAAKGMSKTVGQGIITATGTLGRVLKPPNIGTFLSKSAKRIKDAARVLFRYR